MGSGEPAATILTSIGGASVVVGGLAAWLGKVWADRIAQQTEVR